jgi:hypothetical protein
MFNTGKLYMTRAINNEIADSSKFSKEILKCLARYKAKDWGEMCEEDKILNDEALISGNNRIFAAYNTSKGKIYIITEWDQSVTTVLFATEY